MRLFLRWLLEADRGAKLTSESEVTLRAEMPDMKRVEYTVVLPIGVLKLNTRLDRGLAPESANNLLTKQTMRWRCLPVPRPLERPDSVL